MPHASAEDPAPNKLSTRALIRIKPKLNRFEHKFILTMAGTAKPEEFLFIDPEPSSPSIFLDLRAMPSIDGDDPAAFDDW
jgi:hypothetical protein